MALELLYMLKRFFTGEESGIVESVRDYDPFDEGHFYNDDGVQVQDITIRNPLGELVKVFSEPHFQREIKVYKQYKIGDKFP